MLLPEPPPSRWDLRGRLFGAEVRIRPIFWASCVLLGIAYYQYPGIGGVGLFCVWIVAVVLSLLTHEAGHILAARLFGVRPRIFLSGLGGHVFGLEQLKRWQRVLVLLAGVPGNLLIYGLMYLITEYTRLPVERLGEAWSTLIGNAAWVLMWINALWSLLNVVPLWPLDGGRIAVELGEALLGQRGRTLALLLSLAVSLLLMSFAVLWAKLSLINPFDPRYRIYLPLFGILSLYCYLFWVVTFRALWGDSPSLDEPGSKTGNAA